jgi:tetratricopeptide (TPR) repeat protein
MRALRSVCSVSRRNLSTSCQTSRSSWINFNATRPTSVRWITSATYPASVRMAPGTGRAHFDRAKEYLAANNIPIAIRELKQSLTILRSESAPPEDLADVLFQLAESTVLLQDRKTATVGLLQRRVFLSDITFRLSYQQALQYYQDALKLYPEQNSFKRTLCYQRLGKNQTKLKNHHTSIDKVSLQISICRDSLFKIRINNQPSNQIYQSWV